MTFYNNLFPTDISYGSKGGPNWNTTVVELKSGHEQRNQKWSRPRYSYDVGYGVKSFDQLDALLAHFHESRGRVHSFPYKDHGDYAATNQTLVLDGSPTTQLIKTYGSGYNNYVRNITLPTSASVTLNSSLYTSYSIDATTGIMTHTASWTGTITAITKANPGVVTVTGHGRTTGDVIYLSSIGGMVELNGVAVTITVIDSDTFSIGVDTTTYTTYTSGGSADKYVQPTDSLVWTGEFNVPVRYDTDTLPVNLEYYLYGSTQVPLIEVKV
jgi:uncharacterized protein (TIGR02217 family)